ncbi:RNase adapter RapZ [Roseibaca sp. V10]|uniref:RNase adapter RapZ n=1 Tax=Roseinatronobacter domitianus TaxID=2940293 RepID=A0ABT0M0B7_9RHOB|nr:RNase adapter RapZ [Roseibaca domitiana]MCL1628311.1 RNase adapter RapZ [Roseibaca domitiana]
MSDQGNLSHIPPRLVLVTGPSGSGRSTALKALEDIGFEAIDNMPSSLVPRLVRARLERPLALGLDTRNRDFSVDALLTLVEALASLPDTSFDLLYLDCSEDALIRRFAETRRRHPLRPDLPPADGVGLETRLLKTVRSRADMLIDTSALSPHDLRAEIVQLFAPQGRVAMGVQVQSFSYKRGIPRGVDMVFDCRFLNNPHWQPELRSFDGRDPAVAAFIMQDARALPFFDKIHALVESLLPEFAEQGKPLIMVALGCTGGQHRSVAMAEKLANALARGPWRVSKRHRELERKAGVEASANG